MTDPQGAPRQRNDSASARYRFLMRSAGAPPTRLESAGSPDETLDLSDGAIRERMDEVKAHLALLRDEYGADSPQLRALSASVESAGPDALRIVRDGDDAALEAKPTIIEVLEVIARTDGSRPSFLVRDGAIDRRSSPVGSWGDALDASEAVGALPIGLACVGRIDDPSAPEGFQGTGFLVGERLVLTNRHVLQAIAARDDAASPYRFNPGASIDFGHEYNPKTARPIPRRRLKRVVFSGPTVITSTIDHAKLDLALIEIEGPAAGEAELMPLAVDVTPSPALAGREVFVAGYPAKPPFGADAPTLVEQLFLHHATFGCKRIAPGYTIASTVPEIAPWTVSHDATTLGGNSGSVMFVMGRETAAAALHYGGTRAAPRENWSHSLGLVLDVIDPMAGKTLREVFKEHGVVTVDHSPPL